MQSFLFKLVLLYGVMSYGLADFTTPGVITKGICMSPQFLYLGKEGFIECSITENFYGVYWYNSTDSINSYPLLSFEGSEQSGEGYNSGQYDVFPNGSLIIRNVSLQDDHQFRVVILPTKEDASVAYDISVKVVVQSRQPYPFIDVCGKQQICFRQLPEHHEISCIVNGTRPAVNVAWMTHKASGIRNVTTEVAVSQNNHLYTNEAKTRTTHQGSIAAVLLLCQVTSTLDVIDIRESMVLIENVDMKNPFLEKKIKVIKNGTKVTLACSGDSTNFIIWKVKANDTWLTLGYAYFGSGHYTEMFYENYELESDGSLVAPLEDTSTETSFICIYNDDKEDHIQAFEVFVFTNADTIEATSPVLMIVIMLVVMVIAVISVLSVVVFNWRRKRAVKKEVLDDENPASSKPTELELSEQAITEDLKKEEQKDIKDNTETSPMLSSSVKIVETSVAVEQHKDPQKEANSSQDVPYQNTNVHRNLGDTGQLQSSKSKEKTQAWRKHDTEFDTDESSSEDEEEKNKRLGIFQNVEMKESAELAKLMEDKWTSPQ